MRILMSSRDFPPNIGGVAAVVWELAKALAQRGNEVVVVNWQLAGSTLPNREERNGVSILRPLLETFRNPWRRYYWTRQVSSTLRFLSKEHGLDVIHSHTFYPDGFAARWYPRSSLRVFTNHTSDFLDGFEKWLRRAELSWILKGFQGVMAPSDELAQKTKACGVRRVRFISNAVDCDRFRPHPSGSLEARQALGIPAEAKMILVARRFDRKNGLRYAAQAFKIVERVVANALIIFCGSDCNQTELLAVRNILRPEQSTNVRFEGPVPNERMPLYYQAADVCVLPSLQEATSVTGLESMASGVPVVGTEVGGIPQIVEDGVTGFLVPPANSSALANRLVTVLQDSNNRARLGRAARRIAVDRYSWQAIAGQTEDVYREWASCAATSPLALGF